MAPDGLSCPSAHRSPLSISLLCLPETAPSLYSPALRRLLPLLCIVASFSLSHKSLVAVARCYLSSLPFIPATAPCFPLSPLSLSLLKLNWSCFYLLSLVPRSISVRYAVIRVTFRSVSYSLSSSSSIFFILIRSVSLLSVGFCRYLGLESLSVVLTTRVLL